jgi:hypothetical protein
VKLEKTLNQLWLVLEPHSQGVPEDSPSGNKKGKCVLDTNAKLAKEIVEGIFSLAQILARKWNQEVLSVAVGIVSSTEVAFRKLLNQF